MGWKPLWKEPKPINHEANRQKINRYNDERRRSGLPLIRKAKSKCSRIGKTCKIFGLIGK